MFNPYIVDPKSHFLFHIRITQQENKQIEIPYNFVTIL